MNKKTIIIEIVIIVVLVIILGTIIGVYINSKNTSSEKITSSNMEMIGKPGESSSSNVSHAGSTEISSDTTTNGESYSSTTGSQNALLVTGGTSTLTNPTITKTGDSDGDDSDFYGTNAGVIKTTSNNSGAIMVTGGGTLTANNVTAETEGNSSAPIRSDRGGGTLTVNGGTYTSHGTGSPVIYSTADITVNNSSLTSTTSEGVVVEGKNSVTLNNTTLEATNTKLNGNSETYKAIFIYQSMSGDADVGTSSFTANNSKIINNKGDIIFVTNTNTIIELENNEIINNDVAGAFLRVAAAKWGKSGSNGGTVTLNAKNQKIEGDIIIDNISTLDLSLKEGSEYIGKINNDNSAKSIKLTIDNSSKITLTGDTYVTSFEDEDTSYSNINFNGYKLYVNGKSIN